MNFKELSIIKLARKKRERTKIIIKILLGGNYVFKYFLVI